MDRATLRQVLSIHFNKDELRGLYFDLGVDYEALPERGKDAKIRELIAHFEQRGRTVELVDKIRQIRPQAFESETSPDSSKDGFVNHTLSSNERLKLQLDALRQEWNPLHEKMKRLRKAHAVEAGVTVKFQLEQQILATEARMAQIDEEMERIEQLLQ
jgi:hypothetical protein